MELQDYLTDDEIMEGLLSSSLAKNKFAALELMDRARAAYRRQEELRWPKTKTADSQRQGKVHHARNARQ